MVTLFWFWTVAVWTSGVLAGVALASMPKEPPTAASQEAIDEAEAIVRGGQTT